jgi:hypothetical protein
MILEIGFIQMDVLDGPHGLSGYHVKNPIDQNKPHGSTLHG